MDRCQGCFAANSFFVQDDRAGDVVCTQCGLVQLSRIACELPKRVFTDAERYDMVADLDEHVSGSGAPTLGSVARAQSRKKQYIPGLMGRVAQDLRVPARVADLGAQIFCMYKEARHGCNKPLHVLAVAALMIGAKLRGEVCAQKDAIAHWPEKKVIDLVEWRAQIVRCETELSNFLREKCSSFIKDHSVPNCVYLRNLFLVAAGCIKTANQRIGALLAAQANTTWFDQVERAYEKAIVLLGKHTVCAISAVAICKAIEQKLRKHRGSAAAKDDRLFLAAILAPYVALEPSSLVYLVRKTDKDVL